MKRVAVWLLLTLVLDSVASAEVRYSVTEICRQTYSEPLYYGIDQFGDVAGTYVNGVAHAFLYSNGVFTDLGNGIIPSYGRGINDAGQVVTDFSVPGGIFHVGLFDHGVFTDLSNLTATDPNGPLRNASGINNAGHVAGNNPSHAVMFDGAKLVDLGTVGSGISQGNAINNSDHVAGTAIFNATTSSQSSLAFLYDGKLHDLTPDPPIQTYSRAINASDEIAGATVTILTGGFQAQRAFLYSNGTLADLGSMGGNYSEALALNDLGQVVGWTGTGAFIYDNGIMSDLNSLIDPASGWHLGEADAINNAGQIVAVGNIGKLQEVLLLTPVPEPNLVGMAMIMIPLLRRRVHPKRMQCCLRGLHE